ncbi:hypothetical protein EV360DRAFT_89475 [Lentinula raphanica]|nr:hypothetical protein EV360DRAFT_89475 [Lentinula raphanica]
MTLLTIPRFYPSKLGLLIVFFAILLDVAFTLPTNSVHSTSSDEDPPVSPLQPLREIAVYVSDLDEHGYPTYRSWVRFGGNDVPFEDRRHYRSQKFSREEAERLEWRQTIHDSPIEPWRGWFYKVVNPSARDRTIHTAPFTLVGYVLFANRRLLEHYFGNLSPPDMQLEGLIYRDPPLSPTNPNFIKDVLEDLNKDDFYEDYRRLLVRTEPAFDRIMEMPWKT